MGSKKMTASVMAKRIVDTAGEAGGIDEIRRIAEHGWPCDIDTEQLSGGHDADVVRSYVRELARGIVADVDANGRE